MNYKKIYNNLIESAIAEGYTEKHHIVPKSLGGSNNADNIVKLSARQHYIAHWLLTKFTEGEARKKMVHAFMCMKADRPNRERYETKLTSRIFERYRIEFSKAMTGRKRAPFSKEWLANLAESNRGEKNPMFGKTHTRETKQKMSEKAKGRTQSAETIKKKADAVRGSKRKKKLCPHCLREVAVNGYARWHGDKCKEKK